MFTNLVYVGQKMEKVKKQNWVAFILAFKKIIRKTLISGADLIKQIFLKTIFRWFLRNIQHFLRPCAKLKSNISSLNFRFGALKNNFAQLDECSIFSSKNHSTLLLVESSCEWIILGVKALIHLHKLILLVESYSEWILLEVKALILYIYSCTGFSS